MTEKIKIFFSWVKNVLFRPFVVQPIQDITPKGEVLKRRYDKSKSKTLSDLLDELEYTFESMKIDYEAFDFISKKDVEGLKKFGVSVIPNSLDGIPANTLINQKAGLPTIIFLAHTEGKRGDDVFMYPDFFFAIKQKKCPWFVAKKDGVIYVCGFGYRDVVRNKTFWVSFYATINKDGRVMPTHHLIQKTVDTPKGAYTKKEWQLSTWKNWESKNKNESLIVTDMVAYHFNLWGSRRSMWSTTVERDGNRAIFYVDHRDTKTYFKNREKVVTENGTTKRIIHLVEEHFRKYSSGSVAVIPEHVRGLNKFMWNGFSCTVSSPVHHLDQRFFSHEGESFDEADIPDEYAALAEVAEMLHSKTGTRIKDLHKETA
jgi:hypothetical protein